MRHALSAVLAIAAIFSTTPAAAVPVTWHMTGEVTSGNLGDFFFPFQTNAGDAIAFDFTFDTQTACSLCEPNSRVYDNPLTAFSLTVGDKVFTPPLGASSILLRNDWESPAGGFFLDALTFEIGGEDASGLFFHGDLVVQNTSSTVPVAGFDDTQLTTLTPPDPALFADPSLSFFGFDAQSSDGGFDSFSGRFLTSSVVSTPEPAALALLLPGMLLVWFVGRRASRRSAR